MNTPFRLLIIASLLLLAVAAPSLAGPQRRDHFTEKEVEQIKDTQFLDKRVGVFVKTIERRLQVITGTSSETAKQQKKDAELYGELPTGTRAELIGDIGRILDEAITNIDDVSARDEKNPLVPRALRMLAAEATRVVEQLRPIQGAAGGAEIASFEQVTENAEAILSAANKLPPPTEKEKKSKAKN